MKIQEADNQPEQLKVANEIWKLLTGSNFWTGRPKSMRRAGRVDFTPAEIVDAALANIRRVPDGVSSRLRKATEFGIKWD